MAESIRLVLDFLRQHKFERAAEALLWELQGQSFHAERVHPVHGRDKLEDVGGQFGAFTEDYLTRASPQQKPTSVSGSAHWNSKSVWIKGHGSIHECTEFELQPGVYEDSVVTLRANEQGADVEKWKDRVANHHATCKLDGHINGSHSDGRDGGQNGSTDFLIELDRPPKAVSIRSEVDCELASSVQDISIQNGWLDYGVVGDDTLKCLDARLPFSIPFAPNDGYEKHEETQVLHDCIGYLKSVDRESGAHRTGSFEDLKALRQNGLQNDLAAKVTSSSGNVFDEGHVNVFGVERPLDGQNHARTESDLMPSFNLGSFLDIPVGQEIALPGDKHENPIGRLSRAQSVMEDTPELLSGFATLGEEPTDPDIGYPKDYWESDAYEDDDDPGYHRQPIEDEGWFLTHEVVHSSDDDIAKFNMLNVIDGHACSKARSPMQSKELLSLTSLLEHSIMKDAITPDHTGNMNYDGHLMNDEELKLMRAEPVWQGFSPSINQRLSSEELENSNFFSTHGSGKKLVMQETDNAHTFSECLQSDIALPNHAHEADKRYFLNFINDEDSSSGSEGRVQCMNAWRSHDTKSNGAQIFGYEDNLLIWNQESNGSSSSSTPTKRIGIASVSTAKDPHGFALDPNEDAVPCAYGNDGAHEAVVDNGKVNCVSEEVQHNDKDGADEALVDDGEASGVQEDQLLESKEEDYEVFTLRIIHRKNRTGFEEEKDFRVVINSVIAGRYLVTEYLGSAAFSKAVQARDLQTGMDVCMKIIKNNKDFFDQSLDEIKLLKLINKHDPSDLYHILRLYDYFYYQEHLFIVCELLRANLYEFEKFNRESGGEAYFTMARLQSITRQCLEALEFLHRLGLIHCDLKPENILIKSYSRCEVKVIDLGSSCFQTDHLCSYVQSRSYRAPEVILGLPYDQKIDIWSLGCILAELCSGNVLFQNDSLPSLLARVVGIIGPIMPEMILKGREAHKYFTKTLVLYERNQDTDKLEYLVPKRSSLRHRLPTGDQGFVDFVGYLLQVNPENRPTASEALLHPWLTYPYEPIC